MSTHIIKPPRKWKLYRSKSGKSWVVWVSKGGRKHGFVAKTWKEGMDWLNTPPLCRRVS